MAWTPGRPLPDFDPETLFRTLHDHGVRYVLVGGTALNLFGVRLLTDDVDVCYDASEANTRALARALRSLDAVPIRRADGTLVREHYRRNSRPR